MELVFSAIKYDDIFDSDFENLSVQNGTIEFKHMQGSGGIAVIYAPNGTGKTCLANLLSKEVATKKDYFIASNEDKKMIKPETKAFHVIPDQINRNIIKGKTSDYIIGAQIRREYELRDQINSTFRTAYKQLTEKYKTDFKVTKVGDFLLAQIGKGANEAHTMAFRYIRSIVNNQKRGKDIDRKDFVKFIRNDENKQVVLELDAAKRAFIIDDLSKSKIVEKILNIKPDEIKTDEKSASIERFDDAIGILNKYQNLDSCIVCDNPSFDGQTLLTNKTENRKLIYDRLDKKTKEIFDNIIRDNSLVSSDPFEIKKIVGDFIAGNDLTNFLKLQKELKEYVDALCNEMINVLLHCFDGTSFFQNFDEYTKLIEMQPQLDSDELKLIKIVVSENMGKEINIVRDEENDKN